MTEQKEKLENAPLFRENNFRIVIMCYGGFICVVWLVRTIVFTIQNIVFKYIPAETGLANEIKSNVLVFRAMWKTFIPYMPFVGLAFVASALLMFKWKKLAQYIILLPSAANIIWFVFFAIYFRMTVIPSLTFTGLLNEMWVNILYFILLVLGGLYVCIMPVMVGQFIYIQKFMKDRI